VSARETQNVSTQEGNNMNRAACPCSNCKDAAKAGQETECCECGDQYPSSDCRGNSLCPPCDDFNNDLGFDEFDAY